MTHDPPAADRLVHGGARGDGRWPSAPLLYLERRQSSVRELDQRLGLEADLAEPLAERVVQRAGPHRHHRRHQPVARSRHQRLPRGGARLPRRRRHRRQRARALRGGARAQRRRARSVSPLRSTPLRLPKRAGTLDLGRRSGARALPRRARSRPPGPRSAACWWRRRSSQVAFGPAELLRSMLLIAPVVLLASALVGYWLAGTSPPAGAGHHGRGRGDLRRTEPAPPAGGAAVRRRDGAARARR